MTPSNIRLIGSTLEEIVRDPARFAAAFSDRAVALDPSLGSALSRADGSRAVGMIEAVAQMAQVRSEVSKPEESAAMRHRWAGIQPRHYGKAGQALLDALSACLGSAFGDDARAAWADAFVMLAEDLMARRYNPLGLVA